MVNRIEQTWYIKYTYALAALSLTVFIMIVGKSVLVPLLFSLFFAMLLQPVANWMEQYRIPRALSSFGAILIGFLLVMAVFYFFYSQAIKFGQDAEMFATRLQEITASFNSMLSEWFDIEEEIGLDRVAGVLIDFIRQNASSLAQDIGGAASTVTTALLVPVFVFLILLLRDLLRNFLMKAFGGSEESQEKRVHTIILNVKTLIQKYIAGVLIVIAILSVLYSILLTFLGIEHAIFFGVFAGMLNIIPFVGPILGSILPILYALITMDSLLIPVLILGGFYVVQLFEGNLITPTIVGSQVSMNALATLLLLFVGSSIWGLTGMILFIPIGAIAKVICDEIDSLKPIGYVMGRDVEDSSERKSALAKKVSKLTGSKKEKNSEQNEESNDQTKS